LAGLKAIDGGRLQMAGSSLRHLRSAENPASGGLSKLPAAQPDPEATFGITSI
jgi:hypothetical protein